MIFNGQDSSEGQNVAELGRARHKQSSDVQSTILYSNHFFIKNNKIKLGGFLLQSSQSDPNIGIFWSVLLLFFPPKRKLQWQIMAKGISVGKSELHLGLGNFRFKPDLIH